MWTLLSPKLCINPTVVIVDCCVHEDVYLPDRDNMQVLMIYFPNFDPTSKYCTKMTYTYDDDDQKIGSAYIPSRGIHIQGPGSQAHGVKHDTHVNPRHVLFLLAPSLATRRSGVAIDTLTIPGISNVRCVLGPIIA
jgi:hypothetical protein